MADHTITINFDGTCTPDVISNPVNGGDTISFSANGLVAILCVDRVDVFGAGRFVIPNGATLVLPVLPAPQGPFTFTVHYTANPTAACPGEGGGTGQHGGGPN